MKEKRKQKQNKYNRRKKEERHVTVKVDVIYAGADGVIRMWDCEKWEMTKQFASGHTKGIVKVSFYSSSTPRFFFLT